MKVYRQLLLSNRAWASELKEENEAYFAPADGRSAPRLSMDRLRRQPGRAGTDDHVAALAACSPTATSPTWSMPATTI